MLFLLKGIVESKSIAQLAASEILVHMSHNYGVYDVIFFSLFFEFAGQRENRSKQPKQDERTENRG